MEVMRSTNLTQRKKRQVQSTPDFILIAIILMIVAFGIVMVYSASFNYCTGKGWAPTKLAVKQLGAGIIGVVAMLWIGFKFDYHFCTNRNLVRVFYWGSTLLAASVKFIGIEANGAKRWIQIGGTQIQPSEFVKLAVVLMLTSFILRNRKEINKPINIIKGWLIVLIPAGIVVVLGTNLSSGLVIAGIGAVIMFSCTGKIKYYVILVAIGIGLIFGVRYLAAVTPKGEDPNIPVINKILSGYRLDRIRVWEDPWTDPTADGYQPIQALLAVGSGGLFGVGLGSGVQKLGFLPEPYNDIIFAVICEELGLIGALLLMMGYAIIVIRGMTIALRAPDFSGSIMAIGITSMIGIQAIINVAVNTNTLPTTGMQLPLVSYGGTALVVLLGTLGLLINISKSADIQKLQK